MYPTDLTKLTCIPRDPPLDWLNAMHGLDPADAYQRLVSLADAALMAVLCPECGGRTRVMESRSILSAPGWTRRRRVCLACAARLTTIQRGEFEPEEVGVSGVSGIKANPDSKPKPKPKPKPNPKPKPPAEPAAPVRSRPTPIEDDADIYSDWWDDA